MSFTKDEYAAISKAKKLPIFGVHNLIQTTTKFSSKLGLSPPEKHFSCIWIVKIGESIAELRERKENG